MVPEDGMIRHTHREQWEVEQCERRRGIKETSDFQRSPFTPILVPLESGYYTYTITPAMDDFFSILIAPFDSLPSSHPSEDVDYPPGLPADFERGRDAGPNAWCVVA